MKNLKIKIDTKENLKLNEILKIQGDLKDLPDKQYEKFKKALLEVGFCSPFHIWKNKNHNELLDGTQRLKTLLKMQQEGIKMPQKFPVLYVDAKSKKEARKILLSLASNYGKATRQGFDAFLTESDLVVEEIDYSDFPEFEIEVEELDLSEETEGQDDVPEVDEKEVITKLGDIIELGEHRLLCGDCTIKENVDKLMDGKKVDMVFTDPPYGIKEDGDRLGRSGAAKGKKYKSFIDDSTEYAVKALEILKEIKIQYWWGANYYCHNLPMSNNWLVWDKREEDNQSDYNSDCELCYVINGKNSVRIYRQLWKGMIKRGESGSRVHPTQKPIALAEYCINKYENVKSVIDIFLGSGSTLIACEKTNRKCYGMELDPHYCDVIIKRWCDFTGNNEFKRNGIIENIAS